MLIDLYHPRASAIAESPCRLNFCSFVSLTVNLGAVEFNDLMPLAVISNKVFLANYTAPAA